ncbi:MAG: hypothetical protein M3Q26_07215 [Acidobacteriota bacterium]|nr:hypothetical protein [Acidobacteriota bacterium]
MISRINRSAAKLFCVMAGALVLTGAVGVQSAFAQQARKSERYMITVVTVKPEMVEEYENFVKTETNPALMKGGVKWRDAWKTAMFGNSFEYIYVQSAENMADFDGAGPIEKALGKEGNNAWNAKSRKFLTSVRRMAIMTRPDLSYDGPNPGAWAPAVAVVTHTTVAPNRNAELEAFIKNDFLPVMKQAKVPGFLVSQVALGGNPNEYVSLVLHANMAELEKGPPVYRVMSKEAGDKLLQKVPAGVIIKQERYVSRYSPELSFRPAPTAAK